MAVDALPYTRAPKRRSDPGTTDTLGALLGDLPLRAPTYPDGDRADAVWTLVQVSGGLRRGVFGESWEGYWAVVSGEGTAWAYRLKWSDALETVRHWYEHPPAFATGGGSR